MNRIFILIVVLCFAFTAVAQTNVKNLSNYDKVNTSNSDFGLIYKTDTLDRIFISNLKEFKYDHQYYKVFGLNNESQKNKDFLKYLQNIKQVLFV